MPVSGVWNLSFNFGCSGSYGHSTFTFNNNGTFSTGDGFQGRWSQTNCNVILRYNGDSAIYAGMVNGGAIVGNMINFAVNNAGCWYATRSTGTAVAGVAATAAEDAEHDSTGAAKKKK